MSQEEFTMKPIIKADHEKKEAVSEVTVPAIQQTGQSHVPQEPQSIESASPTEQRDITDIRKDILYHWHQAEQSFLEVGKFLIEARTQVPHGAWLQWLRDNTEIAPVTAQRLMRLAEEYASNASPVTHLGFSKASVLLTLPKEERGAFIEEAHDVGGVKKSVGDMSKRELQNVVREYKKSKSPRKSNEESASTGDPASAFLEEDECVDKADSDPATVIMGHILQFESDIEDILGQLAEQVNDTEDRDELTNLLRDLCNKTLQKLPPKKSIEEKLPA